MLLNAPCVVCFRQKGEYMGSITFTKDQFEVLMKLVYMGEWLVNSHRVTFEGTEKFSELEAYVLSHAGKFGFDDYMIMDEGKVYPSATLESDPEVMQYIEESADEIFWDELCQRLAERDALKMYGEEKLRDMSGIDRVIVLGNMEDKYREIFSKEGLDNVHPVG